MKNTINLLLLVVFLSSCSSASAQNPSLSAVPTRFETFQPLPGPTVIPAQPESIPTINPTDIFITQVMGEKFAAQTQYALLPTITPTPTIPPNSINCSPADLQIASGSTGATGRIFLYARVTNISNVPCFLPSWPVVRLMDRSSISLVLNIDYVYLDKDPSTLPPTQPANPGEPLLYGLAVHQSANLVLLWGDWCQGDVVGGVVIRMFLLDKNSWVDIPTDVTGGGYCDDPSSPSTLDVIGFGY